MACGRTDAVCSGRISQLWHLPRRVALFAAQEAQHHRGTLQQRSEPVGRTAGGDGLSQKCLRTNCLSQNRYRCDRASGPPGTGLKPA
jgi:hypothetical protein